MQAASKSSSLKCECGSSKFVDKTVFDGVLAVAPGKKWKTLRSRLKETIHFES